MAGSIAGGSDAWAPELQASPFGPAVAGNPPPQGSITLFGCLEDCPHYGPIGETVKVISGIHSAAELRLWPDWAVFVTVTPIMKPQSPSVAAAHACPRRMRHEGGHKTVLGVTYFRAATTTLMGPVI